MDFGRVRYEDDQPSDFLRRCQGNEIPPLLKSIRNLSLFVPSSDAAARKLATATLVRGGRTASTKCFSFGLFNAAKNPEEIDTAGDNPCPGVGGGKSYADYQSYAVEATTLLAGMLEGTEWHARLYVDESVDFDKIDARLPPTLAVYRVRFASQCGEAGRHADAVRPLGVAAMMRYMTLTDPAVATCVHLDVDNLVTPMFLALVMAWDASGHDSLSFHAYPRVSYLAPVCGENANGKTALTMHAMAGMMGIKKPPGEVLQPGIMSLFAAGEWRQFYDKNLYHILARSHVEPDKFYGMDEVLLTEFILAKVPDERRLRLKLCDFDGNCSPPVDQGAADFGSTWTAFVQHLEDGATHPFPVERLALAEIYPDLPSISAAGAKKYPALREAVVRASELRTLNEVIQFIDENRQLNKEEKSALSRYRELIAKTDPNPGRGHALARLITSREARRSASARARREWAAHKEKIVRYVSGTGRKRPREGGGRPGSRGAAAVAGVALALVTLAAAAVPR